MCRSFSPCSASLTATIHDMKTTTIHNVVGQYVRGDRACQMIRANRKRGSRGAHRRPGRRSFVTGTVDSEQVLFSTDGAPPRQSGECATRKTRLGYCQVGILQLQTDPGEHLPDPREDRVYEPELRMPKCVDTAPETAINCTLPLEGETTTCNRQRRTTTPRSFTKTLSGTVQLIKQGS